MKPTPPIRVWTGVEIRALRMSIRMSVREFAQHLGVSARMVSKWESGRTNIQPRPFYQSLLDTCYARASHDAKARFVGWLTVPPELKPPPPPEPQAAWYEHPEARAALAERDMARIYRLLQRFGISQRRIAAATGQSQSEISEILKGRQVASYDVLVRIAEGLKIPRGYLGLAYNDKDAS